MTTISSTQPSTVPNQSHSTLQIAVLAGDGIGPEITDAMLVVVDRALSQQSDVSIDWHFLPMGNDAIAEVGHPFPDSNLDGLRACHGSIVGPQDAIGYPKEYQTLLNPSGLMRRTFDLFANIRPAKAIPGIPCLMPDMDLVIVRENTEGFYSDRNMYAGAGEYMPTPDVALSTGVFTRKAAERIAHVAFEVAQQRRQEVAIVHKANVIKLAHGLFLETCREVGKAYPDVRVRDYHIDATAALMVRSPTLFDVILTTNMFGDILSDLAVELVGSIGLGGAVNAGDEHGMAQAIHGAAPDIAGQGIANPVGLIQSVTMLFDWLAQKHDQPGLSVVAEQVRASIAKAIADDIRTPDLGGSATTAVFGQAVADRI